MELKNIAVLGPGGNVGSALINELLKDGSRFNITGITRPTSTYTAPPDSNIIIKTTDYSLSSLSTAFAGQDAVVNCVTGGATQYDTMKLIVDAAIAAGVKLYFANEFVGNVTCEQFKRMPEAIVGGKFRIRSYLDEVAKEGKIAWTALNGGPFFDMWLIKGPAGFDIPNKHARIYGTGLNNLTWTPLSTTALAAANMLRNPAPVLNRPIYISSIPNLTQSAILTTLESVLDAKFTADHIDVRKINKHARIALDRGEGSKAMKGLVISNQFYEEDTSNFAHLAENETVGVEPMSVETAVREAIERWGIESPVVEGMYMVEACEV